MSHGHRKSKSDWLLCSRYALLPCPGNVGPQPGQLLLLTRLSGCVGTSDVSVLIIKIHNAFSHFLNSHMLFLGIWGFVYIKFQLGIPRWRWCINTRVSFSLNWGHPQVRRLGQGHAQKEDHMQTRRRQMSASRGEDQPCQHLDCGHLDFRAARQYVSVHTPPSVWTCSWQL